MNKKFPRYPHVKTVAPSPEADNVNFTTGALSVPVRHQFPMPIMQRILWVTRTLPEHLQLAFLAARTVWMDAATMPPQYSGLYMCVIEFDAAQGGDTVVGFCYYSAELEAWTSTFPNYQEARETLEFAPVANTGITRRSWCGFVTDPLLIGTNT